MKRLLFTMGHEVILFDVNNKVVSYRDRKFPRGVQFIPKDHEFIKRVIFSRNAISKQLITWIEDSNSGKNLAEWEACADDDAVAEVIKKDARLFGCVFRKEFNEEELRNAANAQNAKLDKIPFEFDNSVNKAEEGQ